MFQNKINTLPLWYFESLSNYKQISHFVTSRIGGVSAVPYNSLNLGLHVGDDYKKVFENRRMLASALRLSTGNIITCRQVHGNNVTVITEKVRVINEKMALHAASSKAIKNGIRFLSYESLLQKKGNYTLALFGQAMGKLDENPHKKKGYSRAIKLKGRAGAESYWAIGESDAIVTNIPDICIMVLIADCVPILCFDPSKMVIGVAHAGWRGTLNAVARNTIRAFIDIFSCRPEDIICGIGPSIGPCCYEVGPEIISQAKGALEKELEKGNDFIYYTKKGKGALNLWEANKRHLTKMGVLEKNIEIAGICTYCNPDMFFSYRYQRGDTGRFGAGIMLKALIQKIP